MLAGLFKLFKLGRFKNFLVRRGECSRCGECCSNRGILNERILKVLGNQEPSFSYCIYLEFQGGITSCKIYENRPEVCRKFPEEPHDTIGLNCSYTFEIDKRKIYQHLPALKHIASAFSRVRKLTVTS